MRRTFVLVLSLTALSCTAEPECACRGDVPTGTIDTVCGQTACVGGVEYTCSDAGLILAGACLETDAGMGETVDAPGRPCSETCSGCCDEAGRCQSGSSDDRCGGGGAACAACTGGAVCRSNACRGTRICTAGDDYDCGDQTNEDWVGSECCVEGVTQCVEGSDYECTTGRVGFQWTGARCCFQLENATCVGGMAYDCGTGSTREYWTGSLCCVVGATSCSPGTSEYDCTTGRTNHTWTGTHCCTFE